MNILSGYGYTPLFIASMHGHSEIVKLLLLYNPDVNIQSSGKTPLQIAEDTKSLDVVRILKEEKKKRNVKRIIKI